MPKGIRLKSDCLHPLTYSVPFEVNETHDHTFREITYIRSGKAADIINGVSFEVEKGSLVFLGPMHKHRYRVNRNFKYEHRDIYIDERKFESICAMLGPHVYEPFVQPDKPVIITMPEDVMLSLDARLRQLQLADPENITEEEFAVHCSIVAELVGLCIETFYTQKQPYPQWLRHLLTEMNRIEIICGSFDNLVKISNYSAGHLSREFKKIMGVNLIEYFSDLKLRHALSLLTNTTMPVSEIALDIGYSLSHFIHKFEDRYGVSPRAFRRNHRAEQTT